MELFEAKITTFFVLSSNKYISIFAAFVHLAFLEAMAMYRERLQVKYEVHFFVLSICVMDSRP